MIQCEKKWTSTHFLDPPVTYMIYKACTRWFYFLLSLYKEIRHHERIRVRPLTRNITILWNRTFFISISVTWHVSRIDHSELIVEDDRSPLKTTWEDNLSRKKGLRWRDLPTAYAVIPYTKSLYGVVEHTQARPELYMASWFMNIITCHFGFLRGESLFVFYSLFTT